MVPNRSDHARRPVVRAQWAMRFAAPRRSPPVERPTVPVGVTQRPSVQSEHEPARRRRGTGRGDAQEHLRSLVADPSAPPVRDQVGHQGRGTALAGGFRRGRRSRRCGRPPRRPPARSPSASPRPASAAGSMRSPCRRSGWVGAGHLDGGARPLAPVVVLGPDERRAAASVWSSDGDVERVEVDPAAPPRSSAARPASGARPGHGTAKRR